VIGRTLSLRLFALVFGLACAIFVIAGSYRALLAATNPTIAPIVMAALSAFGAMSFILMAQVQASRRRARMTALMSGLIDHKPLAGLAAAVVAGAASRFGIEPDELFPIFESFAKAPQTDTRDHAAQSTNPPPPQSVH
jgi:cobalamin synthase